MHRISVTQRPDEMIEVDDAEYLDLQRMGLIAKDETETEEPAKVEKKVRNA